MMNEAFCWDRRKMDRVGRTVVEGLHAGSHASEFASINIKINLERLSTHPSETCLFVLPFSCNHKYMFHRT